MQHVRTEIFISILGAIWYAWHFVICPSRSLLISISVMHIYYSALIISGGRPSDSAGQSVELYVPSNGQHCQLPDLPERRYGHSMEGKMICGGWDTQTSCLTLTSAGWETTTDLLEERYIVRPY